MTHIKITQDIPIDYFINVITILLNYNYQINFTNDIPINDILIDDIIPTRSSNITIEIFYEYFLNVINNYNN
jgi:hypothetical protein